MEEPTKSRQLITMKFEIEGTHEEMIKLGNLFHDDFSRLAHLPCTIDNEYVSETLLEGKKGIVRQ